MLNKEKEKNTAFLQSELKQASSLEQFIKENLKREINIITA